MSILTCWAHLVVTEIQCPCRRHRPFVLSRLSLHSTALRRSYRLCLNRSLAWKSSPYWRGLGTCTASTEIQTLSFRTRSSHGFPRLINCLPVNHGYHNFWGSHLLVSVGSSLLPKFPNLATVIDERQHSLCLFLHIDSLVFAIGLDVLKV